MAKLLELTRAVSAATGDGEASVTVIARTLREAGLIATGGRGRQGAVMTASDAASLLIAVGSPGDHTKAAQTVRAAGSMRMLPIILMDDQYSQTCDEIPWNVPITWTSTLLDVTTAFLSNIESTECGDPPQPAPPGPGAYLYEARERARPKGDLTVVSFSTTITHSRNGWEGSIRARLANRSTMAFQFREDPAHEDREASGWKETSISLGDPVSTAIMDCIHRPARIGRATRESVQ